MAVDQSFAVGTHAMVMMAFSDPALVTAGGIADELSLSSAVVRRTMAKLVKAGLVQSVAGPNGGYSLPDSSVSLLEILRAVHGSASVVVRQFDVPASSCVEGQAVDGVVADIYRDADAAVASSLGSWTIERIKNEATRTLQ